MNHNTDGYFITVEGLDGAGKSTIVDAISDGYVGVERTAEPSELETGQYVRSRLKDDTDAMTTFMAFMADRRHHTTEEILPALEDGRMVISDRYSDSTFAYQSNALYEAGFFQSRSEAWHWISGVMQPWNVEPDLVLYVDTPVSTAVERCSGVDSYENEEFLSKVRDMYYYTFEGRRNVHFIDGTQDVNDVINDSLAAIEEARND